MSDFLEGIRLKSAKSWVLWSIVLLVPVFVMIAELVVFNSLGKWGRTTDTSILVFSIVAGYLAGLCGGFVVIYFYLEEKVAHIIPLIITCLASVIMTICIFAAAKAPVFAYIVTVFLWLSVIVVTIVSENYCWSDIITVLLMIVAPVAAALAIGFVILYIGSLMMDIASSSSSSSSRKVSTASEYGATGSGDKVSGQVYLEGGRYYIYGTTNSWQTTPERIDLTSYDETTGVGVGDDGKTYEMKYSDKYLNIL